MKLAILLALGLAACGSSEAPTFVGPPEEATLTLLPTVGYLVGFECPWHLDGEGHMILDCPPGQVSARGVAP